MFAVTHDGVFHADDVFAAAALLLARPMVAISRTRDAAAIAAADIAFDVGGGTYDHHQRGGNGQRENGIPYAAFGLIWRDYGAEAVGSIYPSHTTGWWIDVAAEVDRMLVQQVDAADNGVSLHDGVPTFDGVRGVSVSSVIAWMNPSGDEPQDFDGAFERAVTLAGTILARVIAQAGAAVDGARVIAQATRDAADPRVVVLNRYVPDWQAALIPTQAIYCVYPSAGTWRCQVVPAALGRPGAKRDLPEAWAALDGAALAVASGVADATFCHRGRFIAGAVSRDGATALAAAALMEA